MKVIVVGGGISGLSVLHYLQKKYGRRSDMEIVLLEKHNRLGGTIGTQYDDGYIFENGPNGFLDSKEDTLELIRELGIETELLPATPQSKLRFISLQNKLCPLPSSPQSFLKFKELSLGEKLRILGDFFTARGTNPDETVYEFGTRRFGPKFTALFLDAMVAGIFAGDVRQLNLRLAFPRIYELEQKHGSLFKAMFKVAKDKRKQAKDSNLTAQPGGVLTSFQQGMFQLVHTLHAKHKNCIVAGQEVESLEKEGKQFVVTTTQQRYHADEIFMSVPAYRAAKLLHNLNSGLAEGLSQVSYAPVAVAGLGYGSEAFDTAPEGFGYLNPSSEGKAVLGVLFTSNIFTGRCKNNKFFARIMIGGIQHPETLERYDGDLLALAKEEVRAVLGAKDNPEKEFLVRWSKAIPQYDHEYLKALKKIIRGVESVKGLHLVANYLGGISLNDCILSAKQAVKITGY